jgi:hypothetical protein
MDLDGLFVVWVRYRPRYSRSFDLRDDGVVLSIAPRRELVRWRVAKAYSDELMKGEYDRSSIGKQLCGRGLTR